MIPLVPPAPPPPADAAAVVLASLPPAPPKQYASNSTSASSITMRVSREGATDAPLLVSCSVSDEEEEVGSPSSSSPRDGGCGRGKINASPLASAAACLTVAANRASRSGREAAATTEVGEGGAA